MGSVVSQVINQHRRGYHLVSPGRNDEVFEPLISNLESQQSSRRIAEAFHFRASSSECSKADEDGESDRIRVAKAGVPNPASNDALDTLSALKTWSSDVSREKKADTHPIALKLTGAEVFIHVLSAEDTLAGLSLRYGVSTYEIRRANFMMDDRINSFTKLIIPARGSRGVVSSLEAAVEVRPDYDDAKNDEQHRLRLVQLLKQMDSSGLGQGAAEYYLQRHNFNLRRALEEAERDAAWEKAHREDGIGARPPWHLHDGSDEQLSLTVG